jgi:predicted component of type VI protein secretion system
MSQKATLDSDIGSVQGQILFQLKGRTHFTLSDLKNKIGKKNNFEKALSNLLETERL